MKLTHQQANAIAEKLKAKASEIANREQLEQKKRLMPKAKAEAKKAFSAYMKMPAWIRREFYIDYRVDVTLKNIEREYIEKFLPEKRAIRKDIDNQVIVASIECKSVAEIEKRIILFND